MSRPAESYAPSLSNVPKNLVLYIAYPFDWMIEEAHTLFDVTPPLVLVIAISLHVLLLGLVLWRAGVRAALGYVSLFGLSLAPILTLGGSFGHYLYTATLVFAVAIGWILTRSGRKIAVAAAGLILVAAAVHTVNIQSMYYSTGVVQSRIYTSLYSTLKSLGKDSGVTAGRKIAVVASGDNFHVLVRALHAFSRLRDLTFESEQLSAVLVGEPIPDGTLVLQFLPSGYIVVPSGCSWGFARACLQSTAK
jgi:hypothetical protein